MSIFLRLRAATFAITAIVLFPIMSPAQEVSEPELQRVSYFSEATGAERDYFVYLPRGYEQGSSWPVLMFLHGNGERGDAKDELDYVLIHGAIYEAWVQKKDLPFVIIAPQLPIYGQGEVSYIKGRSRDWIPERLPEGAHPYPGTYDGDDVMEGRPSDGELPYGIEGPVDGWNHLAGELVGMFDHAVENFKSDADRLYLSGLSYGGFGTWYLAGKYPDKFAAIAPVAGFGHPERAAPIAAAKLPIWNIAGGRDEVVPVQHFYSALNELERLGHPEVRFTIHADMGHPVWVRAYASQDLYDWLLSHRK